VPVEEMKDLLMVPLPVLGHAIVEDALTTLRADLDGPLADGRQAVGGRNPLGSMEGL
jgi:hypothetical protein